MVLISFAKVLLERLTARLRARNLNRITTACALALALAAAGCNTFTRETGEQTVTPVDFAPGIAGDARIGQVVFLAGFRLEYGARFFGGLSGLWVAPDGGRMVAVTDHGDWVGAPLTHDAAGRLTGVGPITMAPLRGAGGEAIDTILDPEWRDAEGLTVLPDGRAVVSFERQHRIWVYDGLMSENAPLTLEPPETLVRLQSNHGLEAIEAMPDGRLIAIAESPVGPGTVLDVWVLERNGTWRTLGYLVRDGFSVTDAAALEDGRVIVLERLYSAPAAVRVRLRELTPAQLAEGGIMDGRILAELTQDQVIDNFEGLATRRGPGGEVFLYMVSDDNFSLLQATYLYQFALVP